MDDGCFEVRWLAAAFSRRRLLRRNHRKEAMPMTNEKDGEVGPVTVQFHGRSYTGAFVTISLLIAFLFVANLYTLDRMNLARQDAASARISLANDIKEVRTQNQELLVKYSLLTAAQARQVRELRGELDRVANLLGASTGHVLNRARTMVANLQSAQEKQTEALEDKLSEKAGADDVAALESSVTIAQSELGSTERTVDVLAKDLSVARSELGGLIARTHEQVQALRQLNDREYNDFTLTKNRQLRLGGISLVLKKTDVKAQSFSLIVIANDQEIRNKGHNVYEPFMFYVGQLRTPYELVVTSVGPDSVTGYLGIPAAAVEPETGLRPRA